MSASSETNKTINLAEKSHRSKSKRIPKEVKKSANAVANSHSKLKALLSDDPTNTQSINNAKEKLKEFKQTYGRLVRQLNMKKGQLRDAKLSDSSQYFVNIRKVKNKSKRDLLKLKVNDKTYEGDKVPDGFFDSISSLKTLDTDSLRQSSSYLSFCEFVVEIPVFPKYLSRRHDKF